MSDDGGHPKGAPVAVQRAGEYWVLVPREAAGEVAVVNATGCQIFAQCDGARSETDIARAVADASGADARRVERDVAVFVARLESAGLLTRQA